MGRPVEDRYAQGAGAVYSVAEAARLMPFRNSESREFLEAEGLIRRHPRLGSPYVIWSEVLERLRLTDGKLGQEPAVVSGRLPRRNLLR